jgi:hypothetical protein
VARVVQTSSRHQIYVCARLRVGVRVNVPGTPQHSTVHSSTRDLQGRSLICLLDTSLRREDESARNLPPQQTGLNPSPFRAVPVRVSQQTFSQGRDRVSSSPSGRPRYRNFHVCSCVMFQMHSRFIYLFPIMWSPTVNPIVNPRCDHYMPEANRLYAAGQTELSSSQASTHYPTTQRPGVLGVRRRCNAIDTICMTF